MDRVKDERHLFSVGSLLEDGVSGIGSTFRFHSPLLSKSDSPSVRENTEEKKGKGDVGSLTSKDPKLVVLLSLSHEKNLCL